ncbi:MAG: hypothetical protein QOF51_1844, partial [Chloroflexota bacterium]|nr:hypothetical protein [Chloroflexota bacterium]
MTAHRDHPYRLSRRRLLGLTAAAAGLSATRWSPLAAFAQVQTTRGTLPNGLTVLVEERPSADTVALQLTARVGAREDGPVSGSALLTSRTMFQGTTHRPSESALQREAALVGGTVSRGTTAEQSFYASAMPSSEVDLAFDLLSDVVGDPLMDETAFARQKTIALQELAQRRTSSASQIEDVFLPAVFAGHPASSPVNGRAESIEVMQLDT